jgi:hypothetical protein
MKIEKEMKMLKFEKLASVGDVIRAYDFKPMYGRSDCFIEGKVISITEERGYKAYKIMCINDFFDGKFRKGVRTSRVAKEVYVPMEVDFMEYDARIMNLSK